MARYRRRAGRVEIGLGLQRGSATSRDGSGRQTDGGQSDEGDFDGSGTGGVADNSGGQAYQASECGRGEEVQGEEVQGEEVQGEGGQEGSSDTVRDWDLGEGGLEETSFMPGTSTSAKEDSSTEVITLTSESNGYLWVTKCKNKIHGYCVVLFSFCICTLFSRHWCIN